MIHQPLAHSRTVGAHFNAELAQVTEKQVDRETLFMDPDEAAEKLEGKSEKAEKADKPEKKAKKAKKSED